MKDEITDERVKAQLDKYGWSVNTGTGEGRLMLAELILKAGAGSYNSHTEESFLKGFDLLKKDRTPNKKGARFLCSVFYNHSNRKPIAFKLMQQYRFDN